MWLKIKLNLHLSHLNSLVKSKNSTVKPALKPYSIMQMGEEDLYKPAPMYFAWPRQVTHVDYAKFLEFSKRNRVGTWETCVFHVAWQPMPTPVLFFFLVSPAIFVAC